MRDIEVRATSVSVPASGDQSSGPHKGYKGAYWWKAAVWVDGAILRLCDHRHRSSNAAERCARRTLTQAGRSKDRRIKVSAVHNSADLNKKALR